MQNKTTSLLLLIICLGLGLAFALQISQGAGIARQEVHKLSKSQPQKDTQVVLLNSASDNVPGELEDYSALAERPLFNPQRRAAVIQESATEATKVSRVATAKKTQIEQPELLGILSLEETQQAFLKWPGEQRPLALSIGESHQGWRLKNLQVDKAILIQDGKEQVLSINWKGGLPVTQQKQNKQARMRQQPLNKKKVDPPGLKLKHNPLPTEQVDLR